MLTTFNEIDMKPIMDIRKRNQAQFVEKHGIKLGIMSFFMKAASVALQEFPNVNSMIDGENLVTFEYTDISVAVSAPKGLMVPVVRNVENMGLAEIEKEIASLAEKARTGKLSIPRNDWRNLYNHKWRCIWLYDVNTSYQPSAVGYFRHAQHYRTTNCNRRAELLFDQ